MKWRHQNVECYFKLDFLTYFVSIRRSHTYNTVIVIRMCYIKIHRMSFLEQFNFVFIPSHVRWCGIEATPRFGRSQLGFSAQPCRSTNGKLDFLFYFIHFSSARCGINLIHITHVYTTTCSVNLTSF